MITGAAYTIFATLALVQIVVLAALLLVVVAVVAGACRWMRRFPEGSCEQSGYSHAGNVSGVCPECGTSVAT